MEWVEMLALTEVAVRNSKPVPKPYKVGVSHGLFLRVQPSGGKLGRLKYRVDGREKKLAIGPYPEIGLGEARRRRDAAREAMVAGKDPAREKQRDKVRAKLEAENTFAAITAEFCEKRERDGQRAWHWDKRVQVAQWWSDYLDTLKGTVNHKSMRRRLAAVA